MEEFSFRPLRYRERWFAYLDLLGFSALVKSEAIDDVLEVYAEALNQMRRVCGSSKESGLLHSWFSDTFIIYSKTDSLEDFARLESAARVFFQLLILKKIPVRGCISHGGLYSQARKNIFVGPALLEAHLYGEALDWIGLCLAPSVEKKLENDLLLDERLNYGKIYDRSVLRRLGDQYLFAFSFNNMTVNGNNPYEDSLEAMKSASPEDVHGKYENSLEFLRRYRRLQVGRVSEA